MIKPILIIAALVSAVANGAAAQSVSTIGSPDYAFCADRPDRPEIIENMPFREAHRGILIQRMYTSSAMETVVESEDCSCDVRFPAWNDTVDQYHELYAGIEDRHKIRSLTSKFTQSINDLRQLARPICVEVGNW